MILLIFSFLSSNYKSSWFLLLLPSPPPYITLLHSEAAGYGLIFPLLEVPIEGAFNDTLKILSESVLAVLCFYFCFSVLGGTLGIGGLGGGGSF